MEFARRRRTRELGGVGMKASVDDSSVAAELALGRVCKLQGWAGRGSSRAEADSAGAAFAECGCREEEKKGAEMVERRRKKSQGILAHSSSPRSPPCWVKLVYR